MDTALWSFLLALILICVVLTISNVTTEPTVTRVKEVLFATDQQLHKFRLGSSMHDHPAPQAGVVYATGQVYLQFNTGTADGVYRVHEGEYPVLMLTAMELVGYQVLPTAGANKGIVYVPGPKFDATNERYTMVMMSETRRAAEQSSVHSQDDMGNNVYTRAERSVVNEVTKIANFTGVGNSISSTLHAELQPASGYAHKMEDTRGVYDTISAAAFTNQSHVIELESTAGALTMDATGTVNVEGDLHVHTTGSKDLFVDQSANRVFLPKPVFKMAQTSLTVSTVSVELSIANLLSGLIVMSNDPGGAITLVLPSYTAIMASPGMRKSAVVEVLVVNKTGQSITTITPGTDGTLVPSATATVLTNTCKMYRLFIQNTTGSEAYQFYQT